MAKTNPWNLENRTLLITITLRRRSSQSLTTGVTARFLCANYDLSIAQHCRTAMTICSPQSTPSQPPPHTVRQVLNRHLAVKNTSAPGATRIHAFKTRNENPRFLRGRGQPQFIGRWSMTLPSWFRINQRYRKFAYSR